MFKRGDYICKMVYWKGKKEWLIYNTRRNRSHHVHLPYEEGNAARMIVVRADEGRIPKHYPEWMVKNINRLWFGKDCESRVDLNNQNLLANDETVPGSRKKKRNFRKQPKKFVERKRGHG